MSFLSKYTTLIILFFAALFVAVAIYINQKPSLDTVAHPASKQVDQKPENSAEPSVSGSESEKAERERLPAPAKQIDKVLKDEYFVPDEDALQSRVDALNERLSDIDEKLIEQGYDPSDANKLDAVRQDVSTDEGEAIAERLKKIEAHLEQRKSN